VPISLVLSPNDITRVNFTIGGKREGGGEGNRGGGKENEEEDNDTEINFKRELVKNEGM